MGSRAVGVQHDDVQLECVSSRAGAFRQIESPLVGGGEWPQLSAVTGLRWGFLCRFALLIQLEQPGQDLGIVRLILPAVGCQHGGVEGGVGIRQPGRPLVVEIGERTLLEILFRYWQATDGGRIEPSYSALVKDPGGFGYGYSIFGSG